jgi:arylsulfatase
MIVSWPGHVKSSGGLRSQFTHITDIAPTIFELAGVQAPEVVNGVKQTPLEGKSLVYTFDHPEAPSRHNVQYFEMLGSRGIYKDGWWAGSFNHMPWNVPGDTPSLPPDQRPWELYNLDQDYSQAHNLAAQNPQKVDELKKLFDAEARRNNVYPLEPARTPQPSLSLGRTHFVYHEGDRRIPPASAPRLGGRAHRIAADVVIPASGAEGVIVAQGGRQGGFTLYIKQGRVTYETSSFGYMSGSLVSSEPLAAGKASIVLEVTPAGREQAAGQFNLALRPPVPVTARLTVNGKPAGESRLASYGGAGDTLDIGSDLVSPVSTKYASPFTFTGKIDNVTIDLH